MFVVFDLDGTLALTQHREHFLKADPKDWRGFYAACDKDEPCHEMLLLLTTLVLQKHRVEIWSGRSLEVAEKTAEWMSRWNVSGAHIRMRAEGDHRPDTVLKAEWLDAEKQRPDLVFEDRSSMVAMYRERGIVCCQVAPGDF